ncbi:MAG: lipid A-modifier LpxR family protein [Usitatibacter sp.]
MRRFSAALAACAAAAAMAAEGDARWYVQVDNDVFFSDRWYSSGARLARVEERAGHEIEVAMLQEIFTPEAKRFGPGVVDRAPTARLLLSVARHDRMPGVFQTLEIALGVRGPAALGRQTTDFIHRLVPAPQIDWSRQDSNRFDGQVAMVRTHRLDWIDLHYGALIGNQVSFAHTGAEVRFGSRDTANTPVFRYAPTPPAIPGVSAGWGAFIGASVRGVARNAMLKRQYSASGGALDRRDAVTRVGGGVAWVGKYLAVGAALVQESREFAGQREPHRFGSLTLHADF